ncbi:hypothetical protein V6N13_123319 [Hibiscus sabdariffa]
MRNLSSGRMTSMTCSPSAFTGTSASDLLQSSSNGVSGIPLEALGKSRFSVTKRGVTVIPKLRKVKEHEYPWPVDPDL